MRSSNLTLAVLSAVTSIAFAEPDRDAPGFVVQAGQTTSPEQTAQTMQVPDGFSVKVFAAEPALHQPIAFTIDDRGRLWVVENFSYPDWKAEGRDTVRIFEDTDGDGDFDKTTLFYDKLNMVSAIEIGFGGVWIGSCPNLYFIPDKDGDDVPDSEPEVVLDGWEHQDMHEMFNSFNWGPDGWLYGTQGVFTHSKVGRPGAPDADRVPLNACVWRLHPQTRKFEVFAHGTSNPWGVDFNDYGQCFITACVIPHLYHVIQGGLYERQAGSHFNPNVYEDIKTIAKHRHWGGNNWADGSRKGDDSTDAAGGGHAHAGALVYLGESFPAEYRGTLLMNNIHGNRMNNDALAQTGSGYAGDRRPDFMKSKDKWYRGLTIRQAPDGSVYVADWYDARACHQQKPHDRTNGRIYKIVYKDTKGAPVNVAKMTDAELVKAQTSKNEWLVRHARRNLQERGSKAEVSGQLEQMLVAGDLETPQRLRALWALHATKGLTEGLAGKLLGNDDPWLRAWTIQLVCENGMPADGLLEKMVKMAESDSSPVVRLYLAAAAQRIPIERRWDLLKGLVAHEEDAKDHNLPLMVWYAVEPAVGADGERAAALLGACKIPKVQEFIARRMASAGK